MIRNNPDLDKSDNIADQVINTSLSVLLNNKQLEIGEELNFMGEIGKIFSLVKHHIFI